MGVVVAIGAVAATAGAIDQVRRLVDGDRSVINIVENYTDRTWTIDRYENEHGGFRVTPSQEIPPNSQETFGAQDVGFMTGCEGSVVYITPGEDGPIYVKIHWDNPFAGGNSAAAWCYRTERAVSDHPWLRNFRVPVESGDFRVSAIAGGGNTDAEMRFEVRPPE